MTTAEHELSPPNTEQPGLFWLRLGDFHDRIFSDHNKTALKHLVVRLGIAGFAIHLLLIFLSKTLAHPPALIADAGESYLAAISTPFNFVLFYEVVTLIGALHQSSTTSVANQFEIVSLIFIREVFKDLPEAGAMVAQHRMSWSALLLIMAAYNLGLIGLDFYHVAVTGQEVVGHTTTFYNDLFTVMIFTDVLVLILSIVVSGHYEVVFRSAAFVVSIVLIRFSLAEGYPWGPPLALLAMIFGISTLVVFNYHMRVAHNAHG